MIQAKLDSLNIPFLFRLIVWLLKNKSEGLQGLKGTCNDLIWINE